MISISAMMLLIQRYLALASGSEINCIYLKYTTLELYKSDILGLLFRLAFKF